MRKLIPAKLAESTYGLLARFLMMFAAMIGIIALILFLIQQQPIGITDRAALESMFRYVFLCLVAVSGFAAWYFVLAQESRRAAEEETERQTAMLNEEIEAHRLTDEELQKAKEVAETANLAKSRYIVGVSHEIRAPLNAIAGYAQLLERDPAQHLDNAVRVIRRSSAHLVHLIEGLVDISRIESRSIRIERAPTALAELLDQIAEMFRLQATAKGLDFIYDELPAMPPHVFTDEKKLRQIIINLVSNAIKYTSSGEVRLSVRWRSPVMEIEVADTGVGIAPDDLARIFEPFERVGAAREEHGIGLGLTITRMLAEIMGGNITVHSEHGKGSRFCLKMLFSEAPPPAANAQGQIMGYAGPRRSILAADDDHRQLDLLRSVLAPLGFDYQAVSDGEACVLACARALPDLIILDIAMPGMDGWETARRLREAYGESIAILMISANAHDFQRPRRDDDPHDDFLTKPYEHEALLDRIGNLLSIEWAQTGGGQ
jgi:signal transduction histidine kinase/CheY-like chemotaxis protein